MPIPLPPRFHLPLLAATERFRYLARLGQPIPASHILDLARELAEEGKDADPPQQLVRDLARSLRILAAFILPLCALQRPLTLTDLDKHFAGLGHKMKQHLEAQQRLRIANREARSSRPLTTPTHTRAGVPLTPRQQQQREASNRAKRAKAQQRLVAELNADPLLQAHKQRESYRGTALLPINAPHLLPLLLDRDGNVLPLPDWALHGVAPAADV